MISRNKNKKLLAHCKRNLFRIKMKLQYLNTFCDLISNQIKAFAEKRNVTYEYS